MGGERRRGAIDDFSPKFSTLFFKVIFFLFDEGFGV
jgi:hypothetical protein